MCLGDVHEIPTVSLFRDLFEEDANIEQMFMTNELHVKKCGVKCPIRGNSP